MRVSQSYRIPVIYISGESFRIIKNNKNLGDILGQFIQKDKIFKSNKFKKSEKYFNIRIQGN